MNRYRVAARIELETRETLASESAEAAVESHREAVEAVAEAIGADLAEFEVLEVDELDGQGARQ